MSPGPPSPPARPRAEVLPRLMGPFRLLSKLGQGGVGVVYAAEVVATGQRVALKFLLDLRQLEASQVERFRREGELAARLTHPGIVHVHAAGEVEGTPYLAYELVEGAQPLDVAAAERDVPGRLELVRQVTEAVAAAHALGIVHRDLKPQNVLVDPSGRARVCDFGLATAGDLTRLTRSQAFLGTPTHMAPEQLEGGSSEGARAPTVDVWALGVILYEALTGRAVFEAPTVVELLARVSTAKIVPPSQHLPLSRDVDAVVLRALERDRERRYASAGELLADLEALVEERAPEARRGRRRSSLRFALLGLAAALGLGLVGWQGLQLQAAARRADQLAAAKRQLETVERSSSLLDQLEELEELRVRLAPFPEEAAAARRVALRLSLGLLAAGRGAEVKPLLPLAEQDPHAPLLRAALALEAGKVPAPADAAALRSPSLELRELSRWRAALGLCEEWDPSLARRSLSPLRRQGPAARAWRALFLARLGRLQDAEALRTELAAEGQLAPGVAEALSLCALSSALETRDAEAVRVATREIPRQGAPLLARWRRELAGRLAAASARTMTSSLDKEPDPSSSREEVLALRELLLAILAGIIRLDAGVTTEPAIAGRFATASAMVGTPSRDCVQLLSAAHPDNPEVQVPLLALRMAGDPTREFCVEALPIAERAMACTRDARRFVAGVLQARARWKLERYAEGLAGLEALLEVAPPANQPALRFERARCLRGLARYPEALAEFDWLLSLGETPQVESSLLRFERGQLLYFLRGAAAAAPDMAVFLRECDGVRSTGIYRLAAQALWESDRRAHAQALGRMQTIAERSSNLGVRVWVIRVALLRAEAGQVDEAVELLRRTSAALIKGRQMHRSKGLRAEELARDLAERGDLVPLRAFVAELDLRGAQFGVPHVDLPEPFRPARER